MRYGYLLFLLLCGSLYGQDTIFKRNAEMVVVKVLEITPTEVRYKRFDFQDGPLYTDSKHLIAEIRFHGGLKEKFAAEPPPTALQNGPVALEPPSKTIEDRTIHFRYQRRTIGQKELHNMLLATKDRKIMTLVAQAQDSRKWEMACGFATIPCAALMYGSLVLGSSFGMETEGMLTLAGIGLAGTVAMPIVSGINKKKKRRYNSEAIKLYNQQFD